MIREISLTSAQAKRLKTAATAAGVSPQRFAMNMIFSGITAYERMLRIVAKLRADGKSWAVIAKRVGLPASLLRKALGSSD